jgi:hypothetical protein
MGENIGQMNMALVWHNALQFLTASELLNLVCTCSSASGDNNLAAKRFIRCSVGAVRVFNTADCDKKDQVVEYLASAEVRLIYKFGVTYEMTFNAFCHEHEQYTGCGSLGSLRHCFVPFFLDRWQDLERCTTNTIHARWRLEIQQTAFLHFNRCLPLEVGIVVPEAAIARYDVALEPVDNLSISELDNIDVGLARAGAIVQADVVRNKILSQEPVECGDIYGLGHKYMYGTGANKDMQYALKLFVVLYHKGSPLAANALGVLLTEQDRMAEAKPFFEEAMRNGEAAGTVNLAMLCYELGEKEKALGLFAGAIRAGFANKAEVSKQVSSEEYCRIQAQLTPNKHS